MKSFLRLARWLPALGCLVALSAQAQSFRVQCPDGTTQHPNGGNSDGSAIKCQQIAGGDGYATMGDGNTIYLFGFGPLSGLHDIYNGQPGTQPNSVFNTPLGDYAATDVAPTSLVGMPDGKFMFNGAIGLTQDMNVDPWTPGSTYTVGAYVRTAPTATNPSGAIYTATTAGDAGGTSPDLSAPPVSKCPNVSDYYDGRLCWAYQGTLLDGHVDPRPIMDVGVMNANQPAPLIAIDEDDELFLTLTNVGMIMRPDLFEQHTVHFHGYPNASAFYDGVPDASIAISIGGSFTYYYLAPDAGTYFWHCHISPPEHLQMGMVGQLYVRPRQNRVPQDKVTTLYSLLRASTPAIQGGTLDSTGSVINPWDPYFSWLRKNSNCAADILCSTPAPPSDPGVLHVNDASGAPSKYAYNDGDGSTRYDVEYPIQIHGFDPNFHFVGMTFNPEAFNDMKDKYFLLNGRSYPDTVGGHVCATGDTLAACSTAGTAGVVPGPMQTQSSDGTNHASQPLPTVINIPVNGRALLRISDLDVSEYQTLATLGIPMTVVGLNARLLRDMAGNNMAYQTNSITLAGGESIDVILDATGMQQGQKFYLYTPNLDHLSNDAENFGGLMTEVNICGSVDPATKACTNT